MNHAHTVTQTDTRHHNKEKMSSDCAAVPLMTIAVIGATGGVGRHVVRLALEQGHTVVALARDPAKIVAPGDNDKLRKEKLDLAQRDVDGLSQR